MAAGIGARARSPAIEPTGRSGGGGRRGGGRRCAGCGGGAAGALQRPSALTRSSGATGLVGLSGALLSPLLAIAQSGLPKISMGLENQPPSLLS